MPAVRAPRRRVARPRRRPARVAPAARGRQPAPSGPAAPLPAALLPELAVILADMAWALVAEGGRRMTRPAAG